MDAISHNTIDQVGIPIKFGRESTRAEPKARM